MACAGRMEALLEARGREVAAVILEPCVQGAAGMIVHPEGYLRRVADACRRRDVLLICDEVATGFGRTGRLFACEHEGVEPDLLCLGKGISGGYLPLAATLATERIYEAFLGEPTAGRTFYHGHTYAGNALACAAGLASLDVFEKDRVLDRIGQLAGQLAEGGALAVFVNGKAVARGKAPRLLPARPQDGLQVGTDLLSHVGAYRTQDFYGGLIDELRLSFGPVAEKEIAAEAATSGA